MKSWAVMTLATIAVVFLSTTSCQRQDDRTIDIGTHKLHINQTGVGSPTVVIDVGIASSTGSWVDLASLISRLTRVVMYERAGYGKSESGPFPRHSERIARELKLLLEAASVPPPYVLVGHSLGGLNMQVFASKYPDVVAGMVLLDPPPLSWLLGHDYRDLRKMADEMTHEWKRTAVRYAQSTVPQERSQSEFNRTIASEHHEMLRTSAELVGTIVSFGSIPLVVIASGKSNPMFGEIADEYQRYWIEQSRVLAAKSGKGTFVLASHSSHNLHVDAKERVLEKIFTLVREFRGE